MCKLVSHAANNGLIHLEPSGGDLVDEELHNAACTYKLLLPQVMECIKSHSGFSDEEIMKEGEVPVWIETLIHLKDNYHQEQGGGEGAEERAGAGGPSSLSEGHLSDVDLEDIRKGAPLATR